MRSLSFALPLVLTACSIGQGDGIPGSETRDLDSFEAITNNTELPVLVEVGPEQSVTVGCDENLLELVSTQVRYGTLEVTLPAEIALNPTVACEVVVTVPWLSRIRSTSAGGVQATGLLDDLESVYNSGWGVVTAEGIVAQSLRVEARGRGRTVLAGEAHLAILDSSGVGGIEAVELICDSVDVRSSGSGDVTVTVTDSAQVSITGDGDVILEGDPEEVEVSDGGCGDVH